MNIRQDFITAILRQAGIEGEIDFYAFHRVFRRGLLTAVRFRFFPELNQWYKIQTQENLEYTTIRFNAFEIIRINEIRDDEGVMLRYFRPDKIMLEDDINRKKRGKPELWWIEMINPYLSTYPSADETIDTITFDSVPIWFYPVPDRTYDLFLNLFVIPKFPYIDIPRDQEGLIFNWEVFLNRYWDLLLPICTAEFLKDQRKYQEAQLFEQEFLKRVETYKETESKRPTFFGLQYRPFKTTGRR